LILLFSLFLEPTHDLHGDMCDFHNFSAKMAISNSSQQEDLYHSFHQNIKPGWACISVLKPTICRLLQSVYQTVRSWVSIKKEGRKERRKEGRKEGKEGRKEERVKPIFCFL
jgi:hypothetical protein